MKTTVLIIALVMASCFTFAATYYIDAVNGVNTNNGLAPTSAWKTIAKINSSAFQPGDSILFMSGQIWQEQLNPPSNGNADKPIVFGAYGTGDMPIIDGNNTIQYNIYLNKSYITVDGLHFTRAANCNISQWSGEADYVIVQNCLFEYAYGMGIYVGQSASISAKNWIVRNNAFKNGVNGSPARHDIYIKWATGWLIENNTFTDQRASAVNLNGSSNCIVRYNYSSGHVAQFVQFYEDNAGGSKNNQIYYNVVNGDHQLLYAGGGPDHSGSVIYNNTQYGGSLGIYIENGGTLAAVKNNIFWGVSGTVLNNISSMGAVSNNNLNSYDPLFVNVGTDFRLTANSPCIDAGTNLSLTKDMDGNPVPSGNAPDIGAYEYQNITEINEEKTELNPNLLNIYPNPSTGDFTITTSFEKQTTVKIKIMNVLGEVVFQQTKDAAVCYIKQIDIGHLPKGIYFLQMEADEKVIIKKIIKQ